MRIKIYLPLLIIVFLLIVAINTTSGYESLFGRIKVTKPQPETPLYICQTIDTQPFGNGILPDENKSALVAKRLEELTTSLIKVSNELKNASGAERTKKLFTILQERKKYLVETMYRNPQAARKFILSDRSIAADTKNCLEEKMVLSGSLTEYHEDYFEKNVGKYYYSLKSRDKRYKIHPVGQLRTSKQISLEGFLIDDSLITFQNEPSFQSSSNLPISATADDDRVLGEQRVIALKANFKNTRNISVNTKELENIIFKQTNDYFKEISYNKISLNGKVMDKYYELPINQTCDAELAELEAIKAADKDVDFTQYDRLILVASFGDECGFSGIASIKKSQIETNDGVVYLSGLSINTNSRYPESVWFPVIAHELGHNFGNGHARSYLCDDPDTGKNSDGTDCKHSEYGDIYSMMGAGLTAHFDLLHKEIPGWFDDQHRLLDLKASGTYEIEPIETKKPGVKGIKIGTLYVEYRQPIGFDRFLATSAGMVIDVFKGALLHYQSTRYSESLIADVSDLIDVSVPPAEVQNTVLLPGKTYRDPLSGSLLEVVSQTPQILKLKVTVGKTDFLPPKLIITNPKNLSKVAGKIKISAEASDESGIEKVEFFILPNADILAGHEPFITITQEPFEFELDLNSLPKDDDNRYLINALAYDKAGLPYGVPNNVAQSENFVWIDINQDLKEDDPPIVSIISPTNGAIVSDIINITATAEDESGIAKIEFYILGENQPFAIVNNEPYSTQLNTWKLANGSQKIYAKAYDLANTREDVPGNVGYSTPIEITVKNEDSEEPSIVITTPSDGDILSGTITIEATAMDNDEIASVEFYLKDANGQTTFLPKDRDYPYAVEFDTAKVHNGSYSLSAIVYDASNNFALSKFVTINVNN